MFQLTICILEFYSVRVSAFGILFKGEISVLISFILSFLFSLYILPRILFISQKKHLFDKPDARKSHSTEIPRLGGLVFLPSIAISLSLTLAFRYLSGFPLNTLWANRILLEFLFATAGIVYLYMVGAKDDLVGVRYRKKFLAQFIVASLLPLSGLYINQFYGLLGLYTIPAWIGVPFTVVLVVYITNAINLMDGIDGLAAGGSIFSFLVLGVLFFERELYIYSMLAMAAVGCLLPFFYYNVFGKACQNRKLFMGDTGSLTLGYLLAFLSIRYALYTPENGVYDSRSILYPLVILFIPLFDAFRVMLVRAFCNHPLFIADRNHIHHKCLDAGLSHRQATGLLLCCNSFLIILNIVLVNYLNINLLLVIDLLLFFIMIFGLNKFVK